MSAPRRRLGLARPPDVSEAHIVNSGTHPLRVYAPAGCTFADGSTEATVEPGATANLAYVSQPEPAGLTDITSITWGQIAIGTKMAVGARSPRSIGRNTLAFTVLRGASRRIEVRYVRRRDDYTVSLVRARRGGLLPVVEAEADRVNCGELSAVIRRLTTMRSVKPTTNLGSAK